IGAAVRGRAAPGTRRPGRPASSWRRAPSREPYAGADLLDRDDRKRRADDCRLRSGLARVRQLLDDRRKDPRMVKDMYEIGELPPIGEVPARMHAMAVRPDRYGAP